MATGPAAADDGFMAQEEHLAPARRLVRRTDDRMVAGVCSGLADHFGTDPLLFRLGFVAAAVLGGVGIVVYLVAWALMPASAPDGADRHGPLLLVVVLLALAGAMQIPALVDLINVGFPLFPGGRDELNLEPPALVLVLLTAGAVLLRPREDRATAGAEGPDPAGATARAPIFRRVRPPRERSGLGPITIALVLLVLGAGAAGASAGWAPLDVGQLAALALLLLGAGLVVGAWFGRARLLIAAGVLMVPVVLATSLIDFPPTGTIGSPYVQLRRAGELENVRVLVGQTTLDLSEYPFAEGTERVRIRVAAGSATVIVPHDVRFETRISLEAGEVHLPRGSKSGLGLDVEEVAGPEDATKKLELEIVGGLGSVGVYRMNDPRPDKDRRDDRRDGRQGGPERRGERRDEGRGRSDRRDGNGRRS